MLASLRIAMVRRQPIVNIDRKGVISVSNLTRSFLSSSKVKGRKRVQS